MMSETFFKVTNVRTNQFLDVSRKDPTTVIGTIRDINGHVVYMAQWKEVRAVSQEAYDAISKQLENSEVALKFAKKGLQNKNIVIAVISGVLVVALAGGGYLFFKNKEIKDKLSKVESENEELRLTNEVLIDENTQLKMTIEEIKIELDSLREKMKTTILNPDEARKFMRLQQAWLAA